MNLSRAGRHRPRAARRGDGRGWWKIAWILISESFTEWMNSQAMRYGASLAFYTFFSLIPLLMIAIAVAGLIFGREAAQGRVFEEIAGLIGAANALTIQDLMQKAREPVSAGLSASVGLCALVIGSTGVFVELQDSLNRIWDLPTHRSGLVNLIRNRILSFAMVLGLGFLLLVSLLLSAAVAAAGQAMLRVVPAARAVVEASHVLVSLSMATLLFAMIFKILPDVRLAWRDVWMGGLVTGVLFSIGKAAIGAYLGGGAFGSMYGAASAVVLILLWTYYSALILFFGAEFTRVYSRHFGSLSARHA